MNTSSAVYVFGGGQNELQRLVAQAEGLESEARWLLDRVGVAKGWRVADVGCGPIGILNLLSERVGQEGLAVGIEREPRFADMARVETARRGFTNVRVIQADALGAGVGASNLDFVHERLLLINVPAPNQTALVTQMLALLRPGGIIALQDWDRVSYLCHPSHPAWTRLLDAYSAAFSANGGNGATGRSLAALLRVHRRR